MRIALIADIHGNLPALNAVLADLERESIDHLLCLGDIPVGPYPIETLERVQELGCPVVMGNWDAWFLTGMPAWGQGVRRKLVEMGAWWAEKLTSSHREYMRSFEAMVELRVDREVSLLAFHGSPRSYEDDIFATTPDEELEQMLAGHREGLMVGAHTHFQMVRRYGEMVLVNPGSVGLAFREWRPGAMAIGRWAEYGLVTVENGRLAVELRRIPFDVEEFLRIMRGSRMPHVEWWAGLWVDDSE